MGKDNIKKIKLKSRVLIYNDYGILLTQLKYKNNKFWTLPGGTVRPGETVESCAIRELKEETNLDINIRKLLYAYELIGKFNHSLELVFLGEIRNGEPSKGINPEPYPSPSLEDVAYISFPELRKNDFYVPDIIPILEEDFKKHSQTNRVYLGKFPYIEK